MRNAARKRKRAKVAPSGRCDPPKFRRFCGL